MVALPKVASFECTACGAVHQTPGGLPVGWSSLNHSVWCPECTALGIPRRSIARKRRAA